LSQIQAALEYTTPQGGTATYNNLDSRLDAMDANIVAAGNKGQTA